MTVSSTELIAAARTAAERAQVPYSSFPVGAAVETESGAVVLGCNIESASYGLTICAERVAIFAALAAGERPARIALTCVRGDPSMPVSLTPCGACRQVILDQLGPDAVVIIDRVGEFSIDDLLPYGFRLPSEGT